MPDFVHLHNHSDYSLLDGAQTTEQLIKRVKELGMHSVALTEHGNLFSVINFYQTARKHGIKPIIGCELYVADGSRLDKKSKAEGGFGYNHLLLLAQNQIGYLNLMKLVSKGYLEGFYYRPRVDMELLKMHSEGLIAATACIQGKIQQLTIKGKIDLARAAAMELAEIFPGRFYLEVQNHSLEEEKIWYAESRKLAAELGLPRVATNDTHYSRQEHWEAHDVHFCLGTGQDLDDPDRIRYEPHEFYLKSAEEMAALFPGDDEVLENTVRIAEQCNLEIEIDQNHLPRFPIPADLPDKTADEYLARLVQEGLKERYTEIGSEIEERAAYELRVIKEMGFAGYFLIVQDFVKYAKKKGIPVGPGRGSAAGSLVAYALGITDIDPLKFNLIFERFLNPERVSMPDIDIDFCDEKRGQVIDYIRRKYGANSVTQIITFGKMKARAVIRDVGRVLKMPLPEVDRIAKMIPEGPKVTLVKALEQSKELQDVADLDASHRKLFEISQILEGMNRHASTHAAGVVIAPGELTDYVPLYKPSNGEVTTQFDMKCIDQIGLLKVDFLGLRNLTVIDNTLKMLKKRGIKVDLDTIPEDDEETLKLFGEGRTIGIFQFESSGMREYLKKLKPSGIEDLIAMNALYRPGPMEMIDDFIDRKQGRAKIEYLHPLLETILKDTYGVIVYQEQVMQIGSRVGGLSLSKADIMRRAMGKKQISVMLALKKEFVEGAQQQGLDPKVAENIYALIEKFAEYGFNRSHSAAYAVLAYRVGYLKAHYPAEFMAANLTSEMGDQKRIVILSNEVRSLGSDILPPDINYSEVYFNPENGSIRYGLNAIKNVGGKAAESIVKARKKSGPFKTFFEFVAALESKHVNRKVLESLITSGATDSLEGFRSQKYLVIDTALQYGQRIQEEINNNQVSLFQIGSKRAESVIAEPGLPATEPWPDKEKWPKERDLIGMYLSGHPLLQFKDEIESFSSYDFTEPLGKLDNSTIRLGGMIAGVKKLLDKKNRPMAFLTLESLNGSVEMLAFASIYEQYKDLLDLDCTVFVKGRVSCRGEEDGKILIEEISPLDGLFDRNTKSVHVRINVNKLKPADIKDLKQLALRYPGDCIFLMHLYDQESNGKVVRSGSIHVRPEKHFIQKLKDQLGGQNVWVEG